MRSDDPDAVEDALDAAEDAFEFVGVGAPTFEEGVDRADDWTVQLGKACRLLDACRTLRQENGYYTSVIEMSFAAVERTLESYVLLRGRDSLDEFHDHEAVYDRVDALGLYSRETAIRMRELYSANRTEQYYGGGVSTAEQADAMFGLATAVHESTVDLMGHSHQCNCPE